MLPPLPNPTTEPERPWLRPRHLPALVIGATLGIFALGILAVTLHLRGEIREDIARREGEILHSVAMMLQEEEDRTLLDEPSIQLNVLLKTARLKGVVAARLFDAQSRFVSAFPEYVSDGSLVAKDLAGLQRLQTVARPRERAVDATVVPSASSGETPLELYEILVPLHAQNDRKLLGIAQFILAGRGLTTELRGIDRSLANQALSVFFIGGTLIVIALRWAFGRLQRTQAQLARRSRSLLVDDHEVVRAGLGALLAQHAELEVVGEAGTVASALETAARLKPAVVLLDQRHHQLRLDQPTNLVDIAARTLKPAALKALVFQSFPPGTSPRSSPWEPLDAPARPLT